MIAMDDTRIAPTQPRRSPAAILSAGLHVVLMSAWLLAPLSKPDDMGAGSMTVQLLLEQPPPEPEPPPQQPQPPEPAKPQPPEPAPLPKPVPVKAAVKAPPRAAPQPTATPVATTPVTSEAPAAQPVMSAPAQTAEASPSAGSIAIGNPAARQAERDDYLRIVWARIMRFRPERAALSGTARLRFTLSTDGTLLRAEVTESSGSGLLDRTALNAIERAAPFPPPPQSVHGGLTFEIPFTFRPAR